MVQTPTRQLTLAEFLALPDTKETPTDRSVFVIGADRILQIIDEPTAILPMPAFAKSIQLTVAQLFNWIKKQPQSE